jgi:hypothetical protein
MFDAARNTAILRNGGIRKLLLSRRSLPLRYLGAEQQTGLWFSLLLICLGTSEEFLMRPKKRN